MYIFIGVIIFFLIIFVALWILPLKYQKIEWIETNAQIIESDFSHRAVGHEITYAKGESKRRVKLTVQFTSLQNKSITVTSKVWTYTKNRAFFEEGQWVTILYNKKKPQQFKLKYQI
ncbi:DUF3592 domain-containing protein [Lysinibacillus sp. NPDC096212]|uniref:DUF3592 domain-containing protein n=1 Tax=Lysinibacillus sp. NPDC096212 TaxID=3364135 RepID=UPI003804159C